MATTGFLLGKFMPPHAGHQLLCDSARSLVDRLTILVCWLPDDPIPGPLRLAWMKDLYPDCNVIGFDQIVPQDPADHPDFWPIWRRICRTIHPNPIDLVFASEPYGERLAAELGGVFRPVDFERMAVPISATEIRQEPWQHWQHLPPPVRGHFALTICLHGVESVGKSMLTRQLADHYQTLAVPEYGRTYCEAFGTDLSSDDLVTIARTHDAMVHSQRRRCNRRLFIDTDPLMTRVWSLMMLGKADPWFDRWTGYADHYLLLEPDLPWIDDGTRIFGDRDTRLRFHALAKAELDRREVAYTTIDGVDGHRLASAIRAVEAVAPPFGEG